MEAASKDSIRTLMRIKGEPEEFRVREVSRAATGVAEVSVQGTYEEGTNN